MADQRRWFCEVSAPKISKAEDKAMDESTPRTQPSTAGISIRNGPIDDDSMDIDQPNGTAKRKSRSSIGNNVSYKDESDSDDEIPLVGSCPFGLLEHREVTILKARTLANTRSRPNVPKRPPRTVTIAMMSP